MTNMITRFRKIEIQQLFGRTKLNFQKSEAKGLMIGFGLNGCGKTTMFELLYSLFALDFASILAKDFGTLFIEGVQYGEPFELTVVTCSPQDEADFEISLVTKSTDFYERFSISNAVNMDSRHMTTSERRRMYHRRYRHRRELMGRSFRHLPRRKKSMSDTSIKFEDFIKNKLDLDDVQFAKKMQTVNEDGFELFEELWDESEMDTQLNETHPGTEILLFLLHTNVEFIRDSRLTLLDDGEDNDEEFLYRAQTSQLEDKILEEIREPARDFRQRMEQSSSTLVERTLSTRFEGRALNQVIEEQWQKFLQTHQEIFPELKGAEVERLDSLVGEELVASIQTLVQNLATDYLTKLKSIGLSSYEVKHVEKQDSDFYVENESLIKLLIFQYSLDVLEAVSLFMRNGVLMKASNFVSMAQAKLPKEMTLSVEPDRVTITIQPNESKISLKKLSSGQQHLLTLLYYLCWETEEHSILLIDEPEISLNLQWQEQLGQDLERISTDHNVQFLLATHSPYIFGEKYDEFGVEFHSVVTYEE